MSRKIYAAILGAGTVGTGVYKLCQSMKDDVISKTGAELVVKKVLVRNLHKDRAPIDRELLTDNWKDIIEDKDIEIVIELMGGTTPAKQYILEALEAGKQVVTANKDLLAEYGEEVMGMADKMHADLQFEVGDKVRHKVFGTGEIVKVDKVTQTYEIQFENIRGTRRLMFRAELGNVEN